MIMDVLPGDKQLGKEGVEVLLTAVEERNVLTKGKCRCKQTRQKLRQKLRP